MPRLNKLSSGSTSLDKPCRGEKYDAGRPGCTAGSDMDHVLQSMAMPPTGHRGNVANNFRKLLTVPLEPKAALGNTLATYTNVVHTPGAKSRNTASRCATRRGASTLEACRTIPAHSNKFTSSTAFCRRCRMRCSGAVKSPCGQHTHCGVHNTVLHWDMLWELASPCCLSCA
jgi:hypothetical protein